ncbi:MAG: RHS repeat-associated core domain-containing protein [Terracidiphilus sp.]|jgi:RHS repeat-associated protein
MWFYRGEQCDQTLGLYYLRARYYNPATGRFMSRDPEGGKTSNPRTLHKYLYADGNPINLLDPTGHDSLIEAIQLRIVVVAAVVTNVTAPQFAIKYGALVCFGVSIVDAFETIKEVFEVLILGDAPGPPDSLVNKAHEWCEDFEGGFA